MTNYDFNDIGFGSDFSESSVRLPFQTLVIAALNGDKSLEGIQPDARYFGGWKYGVDDARKLLDSGDLKFDPAWQTYKASGDKGTYQAAANRYVHVAILKGRMRWENDNTKEYSTKFFKGSRMHVQYIVGLFTRNRTETKFHGMAMLTAFGYQAGYVQEAIAKWESAIMTTTAGTEHARLPRPAWVMTLGTWGPQAEFVLKGSTNKNDVTPIKGLVPDKPEEILGRIVPADVREYMAKHYAQAGQWLNAWKAPNQEPLPIAQSAAPVAESDDFEERPF